MEVCLYPSRLECVPDVIPHPLIRHFSSQLLLQGSQPHQHLLWDAERKCTLMNYNWISKQYESSLYIIYYICIILLFIRITNYGHFSAILIWACAVYGIKYHSRGSAAETGAVSSVCVLGILNVSIMFEQSPKCFYYKTLGNMSKSSVWEQTWN